MQHGFLIGGGASAVVGAWAYFADRRRMKRAHADDVGFMPWRGISMLATASAMILFALALLAGR